MTQHADATRERTGCGAHLSDDDVAFRVAMLMRPDIDHELVLAMARDRIRDLSAQLRNARASFRDMQRGDYWCWQGDGEDHPESLTCPIVIQPSQMIELLAKAEGSSHV